MLNRKLQSAIVATFALGAVAAISAQAEASSGWTDWNRIEKVYLKSPRQASPRLYVTFAGISDMCGAGTEYAYYDYDEGIGDEVKSMLMAAFLSGKQTRLSLTQNSSSCRIEHIQMKD